MESITSNIQENIPLAPYTTYNIGGPARYFYRAQTAREVAEALAWARKKKIPHFILGGGSNILVSDKGFGGLVVKCQMPDVRLQGLTVEAEAGVDFPKLVETAIEQGLGGLEWASGIPGSFGGAIRGNAGAFGGEIKDVIESVRFLDEDGRIKNIKNKDCNFSYRNSIFKQTPELVILSATLKLKKGDREVLKKFSRDTIALRASRQPLEYGSCGSVFKAVDVNSVRLKYFDRYPRLKESVKNDPFPVIPMACFIDEADLKEYRIGGAVVSDKHPNFLVNYKDASAEDVMMLVSYVRQRIINTFGIFPEEEVQYIGLE